MSVRYWYRGTFKKCRVLIPGCLIKGAISHLQKKTEPVNCAVCDESWSAENFARFTCNTTYSLQRFRITCK